MGVVRVADRAGAGILRGCVELVDASLQDAPAKIATRTKVTLPLDASEAKFQLSLDFAIDPKAHYLITGRLEGKDLRTGQNCVFGTIVAYPWAPGITNVIIDLQPWT
jgi:hypothetical protein